jgi:hypothetical protein
VLANLHGDDLYLAPLQDAKMKGDQSMGGKRMKKMDAKKMRRDGQ